jgi:hypothetical protein
VDGFIIASFYAALVAASVHVSGVTTRADRAGGGDILAELGGEAKLAAVLALGRYRGRKHFFALAGPEEQADGVRYQEGLIASARDYD